MYAKKLPISPFCIEQQQILVCCMNDINWPWQSGVSWYRTNWTIIRDTIYHWFSDLNQSLWFAVDWFTVPPLSIGLIGKTSLVLIYHCNAWIKSVEPNSYSNTGYNISCSGRGIKNSLEHSLNLAACVTLFAVASAYSTIINNNDHCHWQQEWRCWSCGQVIEEDHDWWPVQHIQLAYGLDPGPRPHYHLVSGRCHHVRPVGLQGTIW